MLKTSERIAAGCAGSQLRATHSFKETIASVATFSPYCSLRRQCNFKVTLPFAPILS